jgi:DedD protein
MGLFSSSAKQGAKTDEDSLDQIRTRARRRLLGAAVLLAVGVIGFPLMFETRPRPLDVKTPVVIPRSDAPVSAADATKVVEKAPSASPTEPVTTVATAPTTPTTTPATSTAPAPSTSTALPSPSPSPAVAAAAAAAAGAAVLAAKPNPPAAKPPVEKPPVAKPPVANPTPAKPPQAKPVVAAAKPTTMPTPPAVVATPKPTANASATSNNAPSPALVKGQFVVQVGAFAEDAGVRAARKRLNDVGLKSFVETVKTKDGERTRVRLGPYKSKDEAQRAADRVKATGLPSTVVAL